MIRFKVANPGSASPAPKAAKPAKAAPAADAKAADEVSALPFGKAPKKAPKKGGFAKKAKK